MTQFSVTDALAPFAVAHLVAGGAAPGGPSPTEEALKSYVFLPFHRTGAAAALTEPFDVSRPARARLRVRVPLSAGGASTTAEHRLLLRGPGDVLGIEETQVVRRYPEAGSGDADPLDLVHVEFNAPDLPWQYTPTGPGGPSGRQLPPWLRLVVVAWRPGRMASPRGPGLPPVLTGIVPSTELPPEAEAWAWAHVQVLGTREGAGEASVAHRLAPGSPATNLSRLVCPTRLLPDTRWIAAVVPTFAVGVTAALGGTPDPAARLAFSWSTASSTPIDLPAYLHWEFQTSHAVNFEELARRLTPVAAKGDVGVRRLDAGTPGGGVEPGSKGRVREVSGPLVRPSADTHDGGGWSDKATRALRRRIEDPDRTELGKPSGPPVVGPPLYGGAHLARHTLSDEAGGTPAPEWFGQLNLDPADRVVAGLGARVVQMDQDDLMARAWAQVEGVLAANDALRQAQFARWVGGRLHERHLSRMSPANQVAVTARAQPSLARDRELTVWGAFEASATPRAATGSALRRMARPAGPVARFASTAEARIAQVEDLLATRRRSSSWVLQDTAPDGVLGLRKGAVDLLARLADTERAAVASAATELGRGSLLQGASSLREAVTDEIVEAGSDDTLRRSLFEVLRAIQDVLAATQQRVIAVLPGTRLLAQMVPDLMGQVDAIDSALREPVQEVWVPRLLGFELGMDEGTVFPDLPDAVALDRREFLSRLRERLGHGELPASPIPFDELLGRVTHGVREDLHLLDELVAPSGEPVIADRVRKPLEIPTLRLVDKLRPELTVVQRIGFRLRLPRVWPFKDWLDDGRLEEVMAAPQFDTPLYQALHRYDREWLLPGVARMEPAEMVTVLKSNPRFMEAFLVGANHEMARELLWREYPTDGRATCFRSFWTPTQELVQPVHRMKAGALGSHVDPRFDGMLVLLVRGELARRYPGLLAHAVTERVPAQDGNPPQIGDTPREPLFQLPLEPNLLLVGFPLTREEVTAAASKPWWFTLSEHVGEPRFGLDSGASHTNPKRDDLSWADFGLPDTAAAGHLRAGPPASGVDYEGVLTADSSTNADAARTAYRLFQLPARAAYNALDMITPGGEP